MSEHIPIPERPRRTDEELIDAELALYDDMESPIGAACARVIASQIHGGQASELYSFSSTGAIGEGLLRELELSYNEFEGDDAEQNRIAHLAVYVAERQSQEGGTKPIEGWSQLWLEQPDDSCSCCGEPLSRNHRVGCPLGTDDEPMLRRVLELNQEHGVAMMHFLNYAGFRNPEELEQRAREFPEYYLGLFPSIEVFRQEYEISPDEFIEQFYEVVEAEKGYFIYMR